MASGPAQVAEMVFESPLRRSPAGPRPTAADLLTPSDDGDDVYETQVRDGVRFSDGSRVGAEELAIAIRGGNPDPKARIEKKGNRVLIRTNAPDQLSARLCMNAHAIVGERDGAKLGSGPYLIAPDSRPEDVRLVRNPHARERPEPDEIHFIAYASADGGVDRLAEAVESGEIDLTTALPRAEAEGLSEVTTRFEPGDGTAILYLNVTKGPLDDPSVRRAIVGALDRAELAIAAQDDPATKVAGCCLPPGLGAYEDVFESDVTSATKAIQRAGLTGTHLTLLLPWGPRSYLSDPWGTGEAIASQLAQVGLLAEVVPLASPREAIDRATSGDYHLFLMGWTPDTNNAADFLESTLHSRSIPEPGKMTPTSSNLGRVVDARLDTALAEFRRDPGASTYAAVSARIRELLPLVPLCHGYAALVHGPRVAQVGLTPLRTADLRSLRFA
jgi:ABC-type transport system substrate-binding protein